MHIDIITSVVFLTAFVAQFSRLFVATRPFWGQFPAWVQVALPPLLPALAALGQGLAGVKSWTDLAVVFIGAAALAVPGLPSNRSSASLQAGKAPTALPSPSDLAVARLVTRRASVRPPPLGDDDKTPPTGPWNGPSSGIVALLIAVCFAAHSSACSVFGSGGSFWPVVKECAPSPTSLVSQVADILLAGGDYEAALKRQALMDGAGAVLCAVREAVAELSAKIGASPENGSAVARGKAFLAEHQAAQ